MPKEKPTREGYIVAGAMIAAAVVAIYLMITGMSQPFNGVEMKARIVTNSEMAKLAGTKVNNFELHLFAEPRTNSKIIGTLYPAEKIGVVGILGSWCKVTVKGQTGWTERMFVVFPGDVVTDPQEAADDAYSYENKGD